MNDNRTMSGVRPYTRKELGLLRESSEAASKLRGRHVSGSDELARWLATLARVEQERDEARANFDRQTEIGIAAENERDEARQDAQEFAHSAIVHRGYLAASQAECARLREALPVLINEVALVAIDGSKCGEVQARLRSALATRSPDAALRDMLRDACREAWDSGHDGGSDHLKGAVADERRDDDSDAIVARILGPAQEGDSDA